MWGNLAGRLGATDINATLEKIGNAVAPREDLDDDDYYDDDGSDDDYDDEEYDEDEDYDHGDGEGIINKVASASPFRLAGMLTQALDKRHSEIGNVEEIDNNSSTVDTNTASNQVLFPRESIRMDEESVHDVDKNDSGNDYVGGGGKKMGGNLERGGEAVRNQLQTPAFRSHQSNDEVLVNPSTEDSPTEIDGFAGEKSKEVLPNFIDDISKVEDIPTESHKPEVGEIENTSFKTTTEAESPLTRTETKTNTVSSTMKNHAVNSNSIKTGEGFTNNKNFKQNSEIIDNDKSNPIAEQPLDLKASRNLPTANSPIVADKEAKEEENEEEKVDMANGDGQTDDKLSLADATRTTDIKLKASTPKLTEPYKMQVMPPILDAKNLDEVEKLSRRTTQTSIEQSENNDVGIGNAIEAPPTETNPSNTKVSESTPPLNKETSLHIGYSDLNAELLHSKERIEQKLLEADLNCKELQAQLAVAKQEIEALKHQSEQDKEKSESEKQDLIAQFHSKEARLLQATSEENQNETLVLQQKYSAKIQDLENSMVRERKESQEEQAEYKRLLRESYLNVDRIEKQLQLTVNKYEKEIAQVQQREERALRKVDDRMAQTMALLDERDEEILGLKKSIKSMESKVNEHQEGEEEAEEELEEVHQENDSLRQTIEKLELEKNNLKDQVATLKSGSEELSGLQMELTMLKEERSRERTKNQAVMESAMSSRTQLETERDNALSELRDLKQQLAATIGDLEISRADYSRITMANDNLQSALEAFQDERRAEMDLIDEQRRESEDAIKSAHATATTAMKQIHENEMYEIQKASDNAVKNVMHEMELVEGNLEKLKSENNQMRRSLDEAIHRLQTTQEDVIDRNVMKNILLDWCTLNDKSKRHQVLQVMANLLHFSEEEKEKVHLTSKSLDSVRAKVVGALAAPLPPSKADVEHLEGSNVHEKWVNFLMAETDDA